MSIDRIFSSDPAKPYVIAEIGFNHGGDMELARRMVAAAAAAGADAVKFQSFKATDIALPSSPHFAAIRTAEMNLDQHRYLSDACRDARVDFLSTPFSSESADMLHRLEVPAFKIASMDLTNEPLLQACARHGKPLLLSTGMAELNEIDRAVACLREAGAMQVALLHCVSSYPCAASDLNLTAIVELERRFGLPVGYSDHYPGIDACRAAGIIGARVIETHFTLDTRQPGGDHAHSADPSMLRQLVTELALFHTMRGRPDFFRERPDRPHAPVFRRGLYAARDLVSGEVLGPGDLLACRPVSELGPNDLSTVIGAVLRRPVEAGQPLRRSHCG